MEFEVNGVQYSARKMKPLAQIHVGRRLAPLLASLETILAAREALGQSDKPAEAAAPAVPGQAAPSPKPAPAPAAAAPRFKLSTLEPALKALASLSDADTEYVLDHCLEVVSRRQGQLWAPIMATGGEGMLMFSDIEAPERLLITGHVLGGMFGSLLERFGLSRIAA